MGNVHNCIKSLAEWCLGIWSLNNLYGEFIKRVSRPQVHFHFAISFVPMGVFHHGIDTHLCVIYFSRKKVRHSFYTALSGQILDTLFCLLFIYLLVILKPFKSKSLCLNAGNYFCRIYFAYVLWFYFKF